MKLKHLIHAALLLLITPLTQAQFATGDVAVFEKKSTAGFELKAVEDTGLILPLANGGLGASLTDPGADRIPFWDDSGTTVTWLTLGTGLSITGTTINAAAILADGDYGDIVVSSSGTAINIDTGRKSTGALGSGDAGKLATFAAGGYLMGTVVSAGDSVTPGNDYITLETDAVNGQVIRGYHTDGMDEHEYILHLPTTSMGDTSVEWWLPETLPTVNGQVLTGQTDGTTAWATASGGIAGSLGSTDNAIPRSDGTGGATLQGSGATINDSGAITTVGFYVYGTTYGLDYATGAGAGWVSNSYTVAVANSNVGQNQISLASDGGIGFNGASPWYPDTVLFRTSAGRMALRNNTGYIGSTIYPSVVAQAFEVYNTYTSSTNYERFVIDWQASPNVVKIGTQRGSTGGDARDVEIVTDNATRITVKASGAILFSGLPGADPGVSGQLWNDSGTLKVSP